MTSDNTEIKGCIYLITCTVNGCQYVGQTINLLKRWKSHCCAAVSPQKYSGKSLHFSMRKHGIENFTLSTLEECDISVLDEREKYWIRTLNTNIRDSGRGYNLTEGGLGAGTWREACSFAQRGEKSAWWGRKHTEATKEKMRAKALGRKFSDEHCKRISEGNKGRVRAQTLEERARRKQSLKQYMHPVIQCDMLGVQLNKFDSIKQACVWLINNSDRSKVTASHIRGCIRGHRKSAYGYTWREGR